MDTIKVIQHNVLKWTKERASECYNSYIQSKPDILLLNSTGIKDLEPMNIFGYNVHKKNYLNEDHAGIAIAVKKDIKYKLLDNTVHDVLAIELETQRGPIIIVTAYLPPRRPFFPYNDIMQYVRKRIPVYILGDLNARHTFLGYQHSNNVGNSLYRLINGGLLTYLGPEFKTYIRSNVTGKPDILLGNINLYHNISSQQGPMTTSDHLPVILTISERPIAVQVQKQYDYRRTNWEQFRSDCENSLNNHSHQLQQDGLSKDELDNLMTSWVDIVLISAERNIMKTTTRTLPHPKISPLQSELQFHYKRLLQHAALYGWTRENRERFKELRSRLIDESKRVYQMTIKQDLQNLQDYHDNDFNKFWRIMSERMGISSEDAPYLINNVNEKIYETDKKLKLFKNYWEKVFRISPQENRDFDANHEEMVINYLDNHRERTTPFNTTDLRRLDHNNELTKPITTTQLKILIKNLKKKAPGETRINHLMLKQLPNSMIEALVSIFNLALSMGYYLDWFKKAILKFIQKDEKDATKVENYRPISLLEIPGKLFEKILNERLMKYLEENDILNENQYAYRKHRGTDVALTALYEQIAIAQRKGHRTTVISRDISRAFDKVWHDGLFYKILKLDLPPIFEKILCNYNLNRKAKIRLSSSYSELFSLTAGVAQGGILSPTLFLLFINDIPDPEIGTTDVIFADDITQVITVPNNDRNILASKAVRETNKINDFERRWKIRTNPAKFQVLSISATKPADIIINNTRLQYKRDIKILGIKLSRTGIGIQLRARAAYAKSILTKLRIFSALDTKTYLHLYKAFVKPVLEYPIIPTCITSRTNMQLLQRVQNKALRVANKEQPPYHSTIEDLHELYNVKALNLVFYERSKKIWTKLHTTNQHMVEEMEEIDQIYTEDSYHDHFWWRRVFPYLREDPPNPIHIL